MADTLRKLICVCFVFVLALPSSMFCMGESEEALSDPMVPQYLKELGMSTSEVVQWGNKNGITVEVEAKFIEKVFSEGSSDAEIHARIQQFFRLLHQDTNAYQAAKESHQLGAYISSTLDQFDPSSKFTDQMRNREILTSAACGGPGYCDCYCRCDRSLVGLEYAINRAVIRGALTLALFLFDIYILIYDACLAKCSF